MTKVFIALCFCGLSYSLFSQQIAWMEQLTPDTGWVATDSNIFGTTNGGANWKDIRPPQAGGISAVFFLNTMKGFVVVSQGNDEPISEDGLTRDTTDFWLCTTEDAGLTWSSHRIVMPEWKAPEAHLGDRAALHFWDTLHGIAEIDGGDILLTNDGGKTWHSARGGPGFGSMLFTSRLDGWIRGESAKFEYGGQLFVTHDGAETWQQVILPGPKPEEANSSYSLPIFTDEKHGFLTVMYSGPKIQSVALFSSTDGGHEWKRDTTVPSNPRTAFAAIGAEWREARLADSRLSLGVPSTASVPSRGGTVDVRFRMIENLSFIDGSNGWAIVEGEGAAQLLATSDAGSSWTNITPGPIKMRPTEEVIKTGPGIWHEPF